MKRFKCLLLSLLFWFSTGAIQAAELRLAVTTSFNNSGLSDVLLPEIKKDLGIDVRLLIVGTGQALRLGKAGDVDAVLVHSRSAEEAFVKAGHATHRREIMFNDFVLIGPSGDPAKISSATDSSDALLRIKNGGFAFVSRGDESGTHKKEVELWKLANLDAQGFEPKWYRSVGAGMGAALNTASAMNAYILADRASWLKFENKQDLKLLYSGDPVLFNQYAFLPVNPERHPHVKFAEVQKLENWLAGKKAQAMIGAYRLNGEQLFTPNAVSR